MSQNHPSRHWAVAALASLLLAAGLTVVGCAPAGDQAGQAPQKAESAQGASAEDSGKDQGEKGEKGEKVADQAAKEAAAKEAADQAAKEAAAKEAADKAAKEAAAKEAADKAAKKKASEKKADEKKRTWVKPVYKIVHHKEQGHMETKVTQVQKVRCNCGNLYDTSAAWKAHQNAYIKHMRETVDPNFTCQGEHLSHYVTVEEKKEVYVVDKKAYDEKVLVKKGYWK